jgi:hypothetical protein
VEEFPAAKYMNMEMRHFLVPVATHIHHQAITRTVEFELPGDIADGAHETADFCV